MWLKTVKNKKCGSLILISGVKVSHRVEQKDILLLAKVIQGFDGDMQQGCELQEQVIDPGRTQFKIPL